MRLIQLILTLMIQINKIYPYEVIRYDRYGAPEWLKIAASYYDPEEKISLLIHVVKHWMSLSFYYSYRIYSYNTLDDY